jgi:hypothetical protein
MSKTQAAIEIEAGRGSGRVIMAGGTPAWAPNVLSRRSGADGTAPQRRGAGGGEEVGQGLAWANELVLR